MSGRLPYVNSTKREEVIQIMNKGAQAVSKNVGPSNVLTPTIVHVPVGVIKKLTRSSPLDLSRPRGVTTMMLRFLEHLMAKL